MASNDDFLKLLRETFRDEADEHLVSIREGLLLLEAEAGDDERLKTIATVYRAAHSLKGASRAVDMVEVETICQAIESLFQTMQKGKLSPSADIVDAVCQALDAVDTILADPDGARGSLVSDRVLGLRAVMEPDGDRPAHASGPGQAPETRATVSAPACVSDAPASECAPLSGRAPASAGSGKATATGSAAETRSRTATIRLPAERLDKVLFQAEELLSVKLALSRQVSDLKGAREQGSQLDTAWSRIAPVFDRVISSMKTDNPADANALDDFFGWYRGYLKRSSRGLDSLVRSAENDMRSIGTMVDDLLDDTKRLLLMPLSSISGGFPKLVRDLSRDLGKDVEFKISGDDVELEKRILERLKDPLVHLLRNSVDHGIEKPERRSARGKAPRGVISLSVARLEGDRVELVLSDDGQGVDPVRLRKALAEAGQTGIAAGGSAKADSVGAADPAGTLEGDDLIGMIFRPGISTSEKVTEISGRGLGMSIVQEAVESLGGTIGLESRPGVGMTVRMTVPVTKATFRGVLVTVFGKLFVIPTASVRLVSRAGSAEIGRAENRDIITLEGKPCGLVHLASLIGPSRGTDIPLSSEEDGKIRFIVLEAAGIRVAFIVDQIVDELEVLVKPLGPRLRGLKFVSGLAVLGTGEHVPILDGRNLVLAATRGDAARTSLSRTKQANAPLTHAAPTVASPVAGAAAMIGAAVPVGASVRQASGRVSADMPRSILIVEDSITSRLLLKNIIEAAGYSVSTAVDGQEGFAALKTGRFDLVVSDVEMPRMDGFKMTEKIRADAAVSKTPVILVTSLESRENRERGADAGADAYLVKSGFEQGILLETIRRLL